jgi:hypothetical protein
MSEFSRRKMIGLMGGAAVAGLVVNAVGAPEIAVSAGGLPREEKPFGWVYHKLNYQEVQPITHEEFYYKGWGCGYAVFVSIVGLLGQKHGAPYNTFPYSMLEVGKSGISEWGTICGALLGAACAMAMFYGRKERDPMVDELFKWYETTAFPIFKPTKEVKKGMLKDLPSSVSGSPLCHISVGKWAVASGFAAQSPERSERCARLSADVARKTVEILNAKADGKFAVQTPWSKNYEYCTDCHGGNPEKFSSPLLKGKMDCTPCHTGSEHVQNKLVDHPKQ